MQFENRLVILFLLLFAVVSSIEVYFLFFHAPPNNKNYGHYPDSIGYNLQLSRFDPSGFLAEIIQSDKAFHYPDTKTTEFSPITVEVYSHQHRAPWVITANYGVAYGKGERIDILGAIHMEQAADTHNGASSLDTADASIFTDKKIISTEAPIIAMQPGLKIRGVGGIYDYKHNTLNILSQVHAYYQPDQVKK